MPTTHLKLRKRADGYYATAWTTDGGRRIQRTFGTDRALASQAFALFAAEWQTSPAVRNPDSVSVLTVRQAWDRFWKFAAATYDRHAENLKDAFRVMLDRCGDRPLQSIGPADLKACRGQMIADDLARNTANARTARIRFVWRWFVEQGMATAEQLAGLSAVSPLRKGLATELSDGSFAVPRETDPKRDIPIKYIDAVAGAAPSTLSAMIRVQLLCGMRPGEAVIMRPCDLDMRNSPWAYTPSKHKTEHLGKQRRIYIGPQAQAILKPFLDRKVDAYCFSPLEAQRQRFESCATHRHQPVVEPDTDRKVGEHYTVNTYAQAVRKICRRLGIPHWSPNELRHTAATMLAAKYGDEAAQAALGHTTLSTTQRYAHHRDQLAAKTAQIAG